MGPQKRRLCTRVTTCHTCFPTLMTTDYTRRVRAYSKRARRLYRIVLVCYKRIDRLAPQGLPSLFYCLQPRRARVVADRACLRYGKLATLAWEQFEIECGLYDKATNQKNKE